MLLRKKSRVITERKERKTYEPLNLTYYKRNKNNDGSTTQREFKVDAKAYPKRDKAKKISPEILEKYDEKMDSNK